MSGLLERKSPSRNRQAGKAVVTQIAMRIDTTRKKYAGKRLFIFTARATKRHSISREPSTSYGCCSTNFPGNSSVKRNRQDTGLFSGYIRRQRRFLAQLPLQPFHFCLHQGQIACALPNAPTVKVCAGNIPPEILTKQKGGSGPHGKE
jgi:hypothetical protein